MLAEKVMGAVATIIVSVAGCLGYDVLVTSDANTCIGLTVSVAGCLGYDVLEQSARQELGNSASFSCWLFRL